jgi:molybdopterin-containing oxidoreductase family iron-sulfur binding subunit
VREGEVKTACQQVCPTQAIIFGNLIEKGSRVRQLREDPLTFSVLAELGTYPRVTYLSEIRNPHPNLMARGAEPDAEHYPVREGSPG